MFKRLSKVRRHSADEVGLSLPNPATLDEPPGSARKGSEGQFQSLNANLLRVSRSKYSRRSCGDASAMQALLVKEDQGSHIAVDADYQMVTAMPAFIVEHEPEKQKGLGVWGRRMSKKIDSFRRTGSRETICTIAERPDDPGSNASDSDNNNSIRAKKTDEKPEAKHEKRLFSSAQRSPSPFKSFFIRMGSTGMLNSTRSNRRVQNAQERMKTPEKENLFRSCSTSQLNTSPTYVKGDDPSEGIDLQVGHRKDKTLSCDNLAEHQEDDVFEDLPSGARSSAFGSCDFGESPGDSLRKSNSCDFKEAKKSSFPYAFLRSKLSVLPEERHGASLPKDERLFKTASEEHFPALKIEESYDGTTTLGRRRSRSQFERDSARFATTRLARNSYAEFRGGRTNGRCEERYSLNPNHLERIEDQRREDGTRSPYTRSPRSPPSPGIPVNADSQERADVRINDARYDTSSLDLDVATLRNHRRNSAPSGEQRLSSHYVSSNESGYDSDGPRGEFAAASENEAHSLKCTDSSDTSSVIDSELEKPIRSSTPSECQDPDSLESLRSCKVPEVGNPRSVNDVDGIDGLKWHQSNSGRMLPSIHQTSLSDAPVASRLSIYSERLSLPRDPAKTTASHRTRLQEDKSRFLSDIIQSPKKVRRCRVVQLCKKDPKESLGIRLAQQRVGELRYVVVQLENDGIAHRDGRLRLGDEIVEVEGKELKTLETLEEVQEFLRSFAGSKVRLTTAYEETMPQVYASALPGEHEYLENAKNLSNMSLIDSQPRDRPCEETAAQQTRKRPDYLPLGCTTKDLKELDSLEPSGELQQYVAKHFAKFEKGYGKPSLGFSVVGGRDSPRGEMGIFVRRVFPGGQADVSKSLFQGDEILSLNGKVLRGYTHQEVIELFKAVREGPVELEIARRHRYPKSTMKSAPY